MSVFTNKLAFILKRNGMSIEDLSAVTGISTLILTEIVSDYCNPIVDYLIKIARGLGVSLDYLSGLCETPQTHEPTYKLPVLDEISPSSVIPQDNIQGYVTAEFEYRDYKSCYFFKIKDDSMKNAKMGIGDKAMIHLQRPVGSGDIVAVSVNGSEPVIRRIKFDGRFVCISTDDDNPVTERYDSTLDDVKIHGKVVCIIAYPE
ncbi:MAG: S24 family peptidase [Bacillota bacterium]|nr:S24 family peptidase [Bacillota bacterium]